MQAALDDRAKWARYTLMQAALDEVTQRLGRAGVPVLAVKGIVTAGWLYANPHERNLTDLDVKIRPHDFRAAVRVAEDEGWTIERRVWSYRNLIFQLRTVSIDLESHVGPPGLTTLTVDRMLRRATQDLRGFWIPEVHDHAVLLTLNVFKDKLRFALPWAQDDVLRMVTAKGFDAATYVTRVREARIEGPAWVVADWAAQAGNAAWGAIRAQLGGEEPRRRRFARLARRLFETDDIRALPPRLVLRAGSDDPWRWPGALIRAAAWELESRWDASRRGRKQRPSASYDR